MGMRAQDGGDLPILRTIHCILFRSRLRMKIDDDHLGLFPHRLNLPLGYRKGQSRGLMKPCLLD